MTKRGLTSRARVLRRQMTQAERLLWSCLRGEQIGVKFVRQFPVGPYIVDFACRSANLVIELDGGQHASAHASNVARTQVIEAYGYREIRFWNNDVLENLDGVLTTIAMQLNIARGE